MSKPWRSLEDWLESVDHAVRATNNAYIREVFFESASRCAITMRQLQLSNFAAFEKVLLEIEETEIAEFSKWADCLKPEWIENRSTSLVAENIYNSKSNKPLPMDVQLLSADLQAAKGLAESQFFQTRNSIADLVHEITRNYRQQKNCSFRNLCFFLSGHKKKEFRADTVEQLYFNSAYLYMVFLYNFPKKVDLSEVLLNQYHQLKGYRTTLIERQPEAVTSWWQGIKAMFKWHIS